MRSSLKGKNSLLLAYVGRFIFGGESCLSGLPRSGKNIWKLKFFQVRKKSGNFVYGQGNLERTWKIRDFENKWL